MACPTGLDGNGKGNRIGGIGVESATLRIWMDAVTVAATSPAAWMFSGFRIIASALSTHSDFKDQMSRSEERRVGKECRL